MNAYSVKVKGVESFNEFLALYPEAREIAKNGLTFLSKVDVPPQINMKKLNSDRALPSFDHTSSDVVKPAVKKM